MINITQGFDLSEIATATMFEDRKRLFVDTLGWKVPVVDGRYEIDAFDGAWATYIVAADSKGEHMGSLRLLPSTSAHILGSLFPVLCDGKVPVGNAIFEITRLCLPARLGTAGRSAIRNRLISAMVDYCQASAIACLTGVVHWNFLEQVMRMGWRCAPLGQPMVVEGARLGAFRIDLDDDTVGELAAAGIYQPGTVDQTALRQAA